MPYQYRTGQTRLQAVDLTDYSFHSRSASQKTYVFFAVGLAPYQNRISQVRLQAVDLPDYGFGTAYCLYILYHTL